jgi:energy-coupling factor transporter transmembrane protein EcfT
MGGLLFFVAAFLPHGPVYLAALILIFCIDYGSFAGGNKRRWKRIALQLGIILLILLGCILEAAVGSSVLGRVISLVV